MSKRKGMSLEDKRAKILSIYHSTKGVFNLKEIEQQGSKLGVVSQSIKDVNQGLVDDGLVDTDKIGAGNFYCIKDVNQGLVDDGLVDTDKIGAGNFYWSFPAKASNQKRKFVSDLERDVEKLKTDVEALEQKVSTLREGRNETKERKEMMAKYQALQQTKAEQLLELAKYAENDPEKLDRLSMSYWAVEKKIEICKIGANRWTDNVFNIKHYLVKKFQKLPKEVDKFLGVDDNFDYIE